MAAERAPVGTFVDGSDVIALGAEAQQSGDVADAIEFGIVFDIEEFDVLVDDAGQDGLGDVDDLASFAVADRAAAHQMSVKVAAAGTFYSLGDVVVADQQGLDFAHLEGTQNAAKSGDAAAVGVSLAEGFANGVIAAQILPVGENLFGAGPDNIIAHVRDVARKAAQQFLRNLGMELRLELRPVRILTAENPLLEDMFFE